jgi:hypothetical protein
VTWLDSATLRVTLNQAHSFALDTAQSIEVSNNAQDYVTAGAVTFTYMTTPTISSVFANSGSVDGGTIVTITGNAFATTYASLYRCRFDTTVVTATRVDATHLSCVSPAHASGAITLSLSYNAQDYTALTPAFTYYTNPVLTASAPWAGSVDGGTSVTLTGTGIVASALLRCYFGSTGAAVTPTASSATSITCTAPVHVAGAVALYVTYNGADEVDSTYTYTYIPTATITAISPPLAEVGMNTVVTISGTNFEQQAQPKGTLRLRIGGTQVTATTGSCTCTCNIKHGLPDSGTCVHVCVRPGLFSSAACRTVCCVMSAC